MWCFLRILAVVYYFVWMWFRPLVCNLVNLVVWASGNGFRANSGNFFSRWALIEHAYDLPTTSFLVRYYSYYLLLVTHTCYVIAVMLCHSILCFAVTLVFLVYLFAWEVASTAEEELRSFTEARIGWCCVWAMEILFVQIIYIIYILEEFCENGIA